jgi:hypothetical protein
LFAVLVCVIEDGGCLAFTDDRSAEPAYASSLEHRPENAKIGDFKTPGTTVANVEQQTYFVDVATKVVLPIFKARNKPFVLVYWSRDPDGTQHAQGDSLNALTPGINGPTSRAAIRNDRNALFIARHGSWNKTKKIGGDIVVACSIRMAPSNRGRRLSPASSRTTAISAAR